MTKNLDITSYDMEYTRSPHPLHHGRFMSLKETSVQNILKGQNVSEKPRQETINIDFQLNHWK